MPAQSRSGAPQTLVVGATGYLGGHLVRKLKDRGYRVRALVRRPEQAAGLSAADEVFVGRVTEAGSLRGVADGIETVFSALGVTRPRDGVGYEQVDYRGNLAVLREAERSGVTRFAYVSVFNGEKMRHSVELADAKERFVAALVSSPVDHTIIRPTGFFSDMRSYLSMARRGRSYLIGDGQHQINPISGSDVAVACIEAAEAGHPVLDIGGPDLLRHADIARLAADMAGRTVRVSRLPVLPLRAATAALSRLAPVRVYGPMQFLLAVMTRDMVAPPVGADHLRDFFANEQAHPVENRDSQR
jgi:uncharacterized protein YbjT (DUF2867 family)